MAGRRLNNVIVPSGEKFYFNDYCAPYTKSNGYELGPIVNYVSSKKLGYGGVSARSPQRCITRFCNPISVIKTQVHSSYGISYVPLDMDAAVGRATLICACRTRCPMTCGLRFRRLAVC